MDDAVREVEVLRVAEAVAGPARDRVAHEEPLEIQLAGAPLAVLMRTPGHDLELVTGFVLTERVVDSFADLEAVRHCTDAPAREAEDNVVRVTLRAGLRPDLERLRRNLFASSSCGVCGKATLENALATAPPLDDPTRLRASVLTGLPERLRAAQPVFDETGGLHAAGLFDCEGRLLVAREDVGRHNAVDKIAGWMFKNKVSPGDKIFYTTGRLTSEMVIKTVRMGIPILVSRSGFTAWGVELAKKAGLTLIGRARGKRFVALSGEDRIVFDQDLRYVEEESAKHRRKAAVHDD
jgi:FdhD protein